MFKSQKQVVETNITMVVKILEMYDWLLDLYVLDFFVDNHWEKLPKSWRDIFGVADPQDFGNALSSKPTIHVLPLSYLALVQAVKALSITRENMKSFFSDYPEEPRSCGSNPKLNNLFLKHVKMKKRHEINLMAKVVQEVAEKSKCGAVVDIGSGLGHLVRVLGYKYDLMTAGIECQEQLTEQARKLDLELEYTAKKHLPEETTFCRPHHLSLKLSTVDQISSLPLTDLFSSYGLVGLHPCGDLGPLLLRHFVTCQDVKFICVVGCCYMKLSCDNGVCGYPLSEYVKGIDCKLSYTSREIACHAIEMYRERLCKGDYKNLKVHAFRASLERILVEHDPKLRHAPVRSIKHVENMTFESYCEAALDKISVPLERRERERGERDVAQWRRVVAAYSLRLSLAPLVETLVLLDRVLYVLENGLFCEIHPVFDPIISPRNHVIIGRRK